MPSPTDDTSLPATEAFDPRLAGLDGWTPDVVLRALWEGQLAAVAAIGPAIGPLSAAAEAAAARLRRSGAGRIAYVGAGTSARLGAGDGAELVPTFDWPETRLLLLPAGGRDALMGAVENAEDDRDAAAGAIAANGIGPQDVVIGLAASGSTPYTVAAIAAARDRGALTIGISNAPAGTLLGAAEHGILLETGAEPIAGSTRMKAGTAQKIALTMLSTAIMVGLGRVHEGRMIDMRPRNAKLRRRAERMVADLARVDSARAVASLAASGGDIKRAVLIARGASAEEAETALIRAAGSLRVALAERAAAS